MGKYRITFSNAPTSDIHKHYDVEAQSSNEAFEMAYKMPESKNRIYSNISIEEIPNGITNIGVCFNYKDRNKTNHQYMIIRAESEHHARDYYNGNIKGKKFYQPWPGKPDDKGNCIYGEIVETYFVYCSGYDFDAVK